MDDKRIGRLPIVGVMGSGTEPHTQRAETLGRWLATQRVHLLTGGGSGVMESVSRAFYEAEERKGCVIGVLPGVEDERGVMAPPGYPNRWVEIPIYTHLPWSGKRGSEPLSRNHINVLTSDVIVALPGSHGTASEIALALRYGRPIVVYLDRPGEIDGLPDDVPVESNLEQLKRFVLERLSELDR